MSTRPDSANPSMLSYIHLCTHKYIHKTPNTHHTHIHTHTHTGISVVDRTLHDIHCFLSEFNFKEVICDSHKLSVKCYNNQTVYFYGQLAFVKASAYCCQGECFCCGKPTNCPPNNECHLPPYAAV